MSTTIGELFDKLSIANIRLWHIEDDRRLFMKRKGKLKEAKELLQKVSDVNKERNMLIDEINAFFYMLATNKGKIEVDLETMCNIRKNKFYKGE